MNKCRLCGKLLLPSEEGDHAQDHALEAEMDRLWEQFLGLPLIML